MRCPWCGSPVMIRGSSWECGWCGDFGSLQRTPAKKSQNTAQITLTLSFVYHVDLPETWSDLKKALNQIAPQNALLSQLLGKVLLYHISAGIQNARALPDEKKAEELRTFLTTTTDLNLGESAEEIMRDTKRGVLFCEEADLSETDCGTFWTELFSTRPVEDYYNRVDPDGLFELFSELSSAYAYFGGKKDEEMGEAQDYKNALEEAYHTHWQNKVLLHPDVERAKRLLAQGKFPDYEDICREILLVEYPEEVPHETAEDFDELSWERVLDDVFADDLEKGVEMWRRLLDIAEPSLKTDAKTAEKLLLDWDWLESPTDDQALPLLVALDDERFVSQLFESAHLDRLQFNVLEICRDCGEETLARHCMDLALKNLCLEERWRKRYTQVLAAAPSSKRTKPPARALARPPVSTLAKPAGESYYQFCNVQFREDGATYAYLTGGISLKAGDFVVVPIGDHQAEKLALVTEVFVCSTQNAPYPPEKAKFVLRKSERTAFPERTKPQHPAPKQADVSAPTESKRAVPPAQSAPIENPQKSAPTVQSAITPPIVSQTPDGARNNRKEIYAVKEAVSAWKAHRGSSGSSRDCWYLYFRLESAANRERQLMTQPCKSCQTAITLLPNRASLRFPGIGMLHRCPSTASTPICTKTGRTTQAGRMSFQTSRCNMTRAGSRMLTRWKPALKAIKRRKTPPRKPSVNASLRRMPRSGSEV